MADLKGFPVAKLNKMFRVGKECDSKLHAEQRTNILLRNGEHYNKKQHRFFEDLRSRGVIKREQKIRLTKNHIHRITNEFINHILEGDPSVTTVPYNEQELQDVKAAQQSLGVIDWIKETNMWSSAQDAFVSDFVIIGEVYAKIRWDHDKGPFGEFDIDRIFGFDMKRDPSAREEKSCAWYIHEQMIDKGEFLELVKSIHGDNPEALMKAKSLTEGTEGPIKIFDGNSNSYKEVTDQLVIYELFHKPNRKYPNGWYTMWHRDLKITEHELPFGLYPIVPGGFDELTTSPRHASPIRIARPYQVEINRSASKMAEHQISLGDDKVFIQRGTKLSSGGQFSGVRAFQVSGKEPTILEGRSGAQYLEYGISQVNEMYQALNLAYLLEDKPAVGDAYQQLYRSMKEKKRFVKYVKRYEQFEINLFKRCLEYAKHYLTDQHLIKIMGRPEMVNIPEFKNMTDEGFQVKVIPQAGDVESKFGKVLTTTSVLQYAGSSLAPDQLGTIIRQLPFGNDEQVFSTLTQNTDNAMNDILALDRGEPVQINMNDDHEFLLKALVHRTKKSDFRFLDPKIQELYQIKIAGHEEVIAMQAQMEQQANLGSIPSGGFLTTVNASWFNPTTNRVERIKIPSDSIGWLVQRLQTQGTFSQSFEQLPESSQARISARTLAEAPVLPGLEQPQAVNNNFGAESPNTIGET